MRRGRAWTGAAAAAGVRGRSRRGIWAAALTLLAAAGCASSHGGSPPALAGLDVPRWITAGSGAFDDAGAKVFYGVGQVGGIANQALARTTADNRARAEIARTFETYSAALMRDYAASTRTDAPQGAAEEQQVEQAIRTFSAASLSGVQIVDHWFHPSDGTIYALARLDLDGFVESLARMQALDDATRAFVRENAARMHGQLADEEARRRGRGAPTP